MAKSDDQRNSRFHLDTGIAVDWPMEDIRAVTNAVEDLWRRHRDHGSRLKALTSLVRPYARQYGGLPDALHRSLTPLVNEVTGYYKAKEEFWKAAMPPAVPEPVEPAAAQAAATSASEMPSIMAPVVDGTSDSTSTAKPVVRVLHDVNTSTLVIKLPDVPLMAYQSGWH